MYRNDSSIDLYAKISEKVNDNYHFGQLFWCVSIDIQHNMVGFVMKVHN